MQVHPGLFASGVSWLSGAAFKHSLAHYSNTALACTYVRDRGSGQVTIDKDGKPRLHYTISPFDQKSIWKVPPLLCIPGGSSSSFTQHRGPRA